MLANSLQTDSGLVNGDHLSLLSIASTLRRGSDEDIDHISGAKLKNTPTEQSFYMNIDEVIDQMSELSLKSKSEALSTIGNKFANSGQYSEAIRYYSKAIALYDEDYRLYCNRSFCYEKLMNYEDSLADALRSVILMPTKPKPYFRQGKALIGLKRYSDAEKAFNKIIQINSECEDTKKELLKTRYLALRDYGLSIDDASILAINSKSIDEAIEASVGKQRTNPGVGGDAQQLDSNYDYLNNLKPLIKSQDSLDSRPTHHNRQMSASVRPFVSFSQLQRSSVGAHHRRSLSRPPARLNQMYVNSNHINGTNQTNSTFMARPLHKRSNSVDNILRYKKSGQSEQMFVKRFREYRLPKNLFGYKGLWIGNVSPNCKVTQLRTVFGRYGAVEYVNVVSHSYCAFVNYQNPNCPRIAIANLYGQTIPGISNGERPLVFRFIPSNDQKDLHFMRPYQPKGTNECYFWRTTGCKDWNCPLIHYPVCRGIDFQPWMKNKYKKFY